jgi:hypothetical protein
MGRASTPMIDFDVETVLVARADEVPVQDVLALDADIALGKLPEKDA